MGISSKEVARGLNGKSARAQSDRKGFRDKPRRIWVSKEVTVNSDPEKPKMANTSNLLQCRDNVFIE